MYGFTICVWIVWSAGNSPYWNVRAEFSCEQRAQGQRQTDCYAGQTQPAGLSRPRHGGFRSSTAEQNIREQEL